ncbi:hypothetical protein EJC51_44410 [Streptomyces aquilus]|uniref:Uncharacterized protein n=1 Tax=Streptomyces aquilus TaxID=2548456 RepID=A0A3Q9C5R4_9ACTN|nr:hypothetical protein [Streptomyces aquilus]AZP22507.1 hypothetical protein EJC51_44410 [Streptomyces aquilus]
MKAVIVGSAGGIGSSAAFNLLSTRGAYEIVLVDTRPNMITRHTADNARIVEERLHPVREAGADFHGLRRTAEVLEGSDRALSPLPGERVQDFRDRDRVQRADV